MREVGEPKEVQRETQTQYNPRGTQRPDVGGVSGGWGWVSVRPSSVYTKVTLTYHTPLLYVGPRKGISKGGQ